VPQARLQRLARGDCPLSQQRNAGAGVEVGLLGLNQRPGERNGAVGPVRVLLDVHPHAPRFGLGEASVPPLGSYLGS
jgi:hypothetical protein